MRTAVTSGCLIGLGLVARVTPARAEILGLQRVGSGLTDPMFVTHAPGDPHRLFIAERGG